MGNLFISQNCLELSPILPTYQNVLLGAENVHQFQEEQTRNNLKLEKKHSSEGTGRRGGIPLGRCVGKNVTEIHKHARGAEVWGGRHCVHIYSRHCVCTILDIGWGWGASRTHRIFYPKKKKTAHTYVATTGRLLVVATMPWFSYFVPTFT